MLFSCTFHQVNMAAHHVIVNCPWPCVANCLFFSSDLVVGRRTLFTGTSPNFVLKVIVSVTELQMV